MALTRDQLVDGLSKVGLYGVATSGMLDYILEGGDDYSSDIADLKEKNTNLEQLTKVVDFKVDNTAANTVILDQRVGELESKATPKDFTTDISAIKSRALVQDSKLNELDAGMMNKAPLVSGKVPYEHLPEFPVGRKVNVEDIDTRLVLTPYSDLTIAYQSDTGDAWALDANDDPAIPSNWSKLGNAQGVGVSSFNGRTGNIGPMSGDYDAGKISELVDKRFVSTAQISKWDATASLSYNADSITETASRKWLTPEQITSWNNKETAENSQTKATAAQTTAITLAKVYADSTFIAASQKGVANGVAPLGEDGKVPATHLPLSQKARVWLDVKSSRSYNTWTTNSSGDTEVYIRTNAISDNAKYVTINMRATSSSPSMAFSSTFDNATGNRYIAFQVTVPAGWQYAVQIAGGTTASTMNSISVWRELS